MSFLRRFGGSASGPSPAGVTAEPPPKREWHQENDGERYFGLENFGNTCYANSVLQALYFSKPFRELIESYHPTPLPIPSTIPSTPSTVSVPLPDPATLRPATAPTDRRPSKSVTASTLGRKNSKRPGTGSGRSSLANAFGSRRQASVPYKEDPPEAPKLPSHASAASEGGAPLSTRSSFSGVGTPVMNAVDTPSADSTLLTTLRDLFVAISAQPTNTGTIAPQAFINQLKRDNEFFRSTLHQDAHEFLNYLINMVAEAVEKVDKLERTPSGSDISGNSERGCAKTWVHHLFEGVLTNETRCLSCETVTSRDEAFLDLSIDIEPNSSVTACLRQFSASEMLCQRNKFSCDKCCGLQEAEKRMKIKKLPNILALHLKRFKYEESLQRYVKLTYRVVFPFELRLFNTADGVGNPDRLYELWAIVVHIGVGPHHGHYIAIVKSAALWIVFDDNSVYPIEEKEIQKFFGDTPGQGSGYVLFYEATDLDLHGVKIQRNIPTGDISSASLPLPIPSLPADAFITTPRPPPNWTDSKIDRLAQDGSEDSFRTPSTTPASSHFGPPTLAPPPPPPAVVAPRPSLPPSLEHASTNGKDPESGGNKSWRMGRSLSLGRDGKKSLPQESPTMSVPEVPTSPVAALLSNYTLGPSSPPSQVELPFRPRPLLTVPTSSTEHPPPLSPRSPTPEEPNRLFAGVPLSTGVPATPGSEDGSASTTSTNLLTGTSTPARHGSRASMDVNHSNGGALGFLHRKNRKISHSESATFPPSTHLMNGSQLSSEVPSGAGTPLIGALSSNGDRKEVERRLKEEKKVREKEEERRSKEYAKVLKEEKKRLKEAAELAKKNEKRERKLSVKA